MKTRASKTAKKVPPKKKASTKSKGTAKMKKTSVKKELISALPGQCFWVHDGPVLKNLWDLQQALQNDISDIQFEYHCSNGKSDFSLWVNDILCDKACAKALGQAKNIKEAEKAVRACLKKYQ